MELIRVLFFFPTYFILCSSAPIDRQEERKKLERKLEFVPSENHKLFLMNEIFEAKEDAEKAEAAKFENHLQIQMNLMKKMGIISYYPNRIIRLEWSVSGYSMVQKFMQDVDLNKIFVPTGIPPDKNESYKSRYKTWLGVARAMKNTSNSYLIKIKNIFSDLGLDVNDEESVATTAATFFVNMSDDAKKYGIEVKYENENEVGAALQAWRIKDENQIAFAKAIFRLDL